MNKDDTQQVYRVGVTILLTNDTCQLKKHDKDGKHYTIQIN